MSSQETSVQCVKKPSVEINSKVIYIQTCPNFFFVNLALYRTFIDKTGKAFRVPLGSRKAAWNFFFPWIGLKWVEPPSGWRTPLLKQWRPPTSLLTCPHSNTGKKIKPDGQVKIHDEILPFEVHAPRAHNQEWSLVCVCVCLCGISLSQSARLQNQTQCVESSLLYIQFCSKCTQVSDKRAQASAREAMFPSGNRSRFAGFPTV